MSERTPAPISALARLLTAPAAAFPRRGFMLDVSRCRVPTMDTMRGLVDLLAALRFNELQLYTEHTFAYRGHEVVWRDASPLTPDDVRTLDGWCAARGLEFVPNQNSLGHFERWLRHAPYAPLAEARGSYVTPWGERRTMPSTLRPGPEAEALLADLYGQLLPCFTSRRFNVGCDEPFELGQGASAEAVAARGRAAVFLDHLGAVHRLAAAHGRTIEFWADVLLEEHADLARVPADATALVWGYEAAHPFDAQCARVAASGRRFHVCPGDSTWCSLGGRLHTAYPNLTAAAHAGRAHGAAGFLVTHWGDGGHWQPWVTMLPGLVLAATAAWNGAPCPEGDLAAALDALAGDTSGRFGAALIALGRLDELHGHNPTNRSLLWEALFKPRDYLRLGDRLAAVPAEAWRALDARVAELGGTFASLAGQPGIDRQLVDEAAHSTRLVRGALTRAATLLGAPPPDDWPATRTTLQETHRALWLRRSRPGGLAESTALLDAV